MSDDILLNSLEEKSKEFIVNNRRKGPDFLANVVNIFNYLIWAILLVALSICDGAGIELFKLSFIPISKLNLGFVYLAINLTGVLFVVSCTLLLLSFKRCRRRNDKIKTSIFIGEILSFVIWMSLVIKIYF